MKNPITNHVIFLTALAWAAGLYVVPFLLAIVFYQTRLPIINQVGPLIGAAIYSQFIGPALGGAIAGYLTASLFKRLPGLQAIQPRFSLPIWAVALFLAVFLVFTLGFLFMPPPVDPVALSDPMEPPPARPIPVIPLLANGFVTWLLPGILGGLLFAIEIHHDSLKLGARRIAQITAGWGFGFALGGSISMVIANVALRGLFPFDEARWLVTYTALWLQYGLTGLIAGAVGAWATLRAIRSVSPTLL